MTVPYRLDAFVAPFAGWESQGIYQTTELREAQQRVRELEQELAALRFPVEGMSGEFTANGGMRAWRTGDGGYVVLVFSRDKCRYCGSETAALHMNGRYDDGVCVCQSCLNKMFDVYQAKVTG